MLSSSVAKYQALHRARPSERRFFLSETNRYFTARASKSELKSCKIHFVGYFAFF
jgi:hypothetical protein